MFIDLLKEWLGSLFLPSARFAEVPYGSSLDLLPEGLPSKRSLSEEVEGNSQQLAPGSRSIRELAASESQFSASANCYREKRLGDVKEMFQQSSSKTDSASSGGLVAGVQSLVLGQREVGESAVIPGALATLQNYPDSNTFALPLVPVSRPKAAHSGEATEVLLRQAKAYMQVEAWDKALMACQDAIAVSPDIAEAHKLIGNILQEMGRGIDALGHYARALLANPSFPEVYANLGSFYARQQAWEDAESYYRKAVNLRPDSAVFYRPLSKVLEAAGKSEEAMEVFAQAVSLAPDLSSPLEHYQVGNFFLEQGQEDQAIECYQYAVKPDRACIEAYLPLAELLEKRGEWQAATLYYRKAFETEALAEKKLEAGSTLRSETVALPAQKLNGLAKVIPAKVVPVQSRLTAVQPPVISNRIRVLQPPLTNTAVPETPKKQANGAVSPEALQGRNGSVPSEAQTSSHSESLLTPDHDSDNGLQAAINSYRKSLEVNPRQPQVYRELARALTKSNQLEAAAQAWFKAFRLVPQDATAEQHFNLGNSLVQQGQLDQGKVCYQQAIQLNPGYAAAYEALGHVLDRQNSPSEAAEAYREALKLKGAVPVKK